jgi:hypothetical protein
MKKEFKELGTICVKLWRVHKQGKAHQWTAKDPNEGMSSVPEKALKGRAISCTTRYEHTPDIMAL